MTFPPEIHRTALRLSNAWDQLWQKREEAARSGLIQKFYELDEKIDKLQRRIDRFGERLRNYIAAS